MVHIISKQDGPRKEDVSARSFIQNNRATIAGLADALSGGSWRQRRRPGIAPQPEASGKLWFTPPSRPQPARPYVRISPNGRVVVADLASGNQMHFLGELRGSRFMLASERNGFFAPLEGELQEVLAGLDGMALPDETAEERLKEEIAARLGLDAAAGTTD